MKKKNLTINTLALGNLRQRRKQYAIMIIGIILAMILSSSTLFFIFSSSETYYADREMKIGKQLMIISDYHHGNELYENAVNDRVIDDYGLAHIIGFGYTDGGENLGTAIGWLDDKAKDISNQFFVEGSYPVHENEIAIEETALFKLGIDAKVGDEITFLLKPQNSYDYLEPIEKTYMLTGIVSDKRQNLTGRWHEEENLYHNLIIPAAFVAQGTQTELGGKERLSSYIFLKNQSKGHDENRKDIDRVLDYIDGFLGEDEYVHPFTDNAYNEILGGYYSYEGIISGGKNVMIIAAALIFASCMAIINSFNANLKERKKQIGMLRAVGATRRQIIKVFGREALIISLISTPISIAVSYGIVRVAISLLNDHAVFTKSIWVLPLCAAVCMAATMLSALIPLLAAARITPMQAIRNIDITRKMRVKNIKSKKRFSVSTHLAGRNSKLYRNGRIAVCVILTIVILISCLGFALINDERSSFDPLEYDYSLYSGTSYPADYVNYGRVGLSEADKQDIDLAPYFSYVAAEKKITAIVELEEFSDYHLRIVSKRKVIADWYSKFIPDIESYMNAKFNPSTKDYQEYKNRYGNGKEILAAPIYSLDDHVLKSLEERLISGRINVDKLSVGDEVILVAPQTAIYTEHSVNGIPKEVYFEDEEIAPEQSFLSESECPYSVGDKIKISVIEYIDQDDFYDNPEDYTRIDSEVTVSAIISPLTLSQISDITDSFALLTTHSGLSLLSPNTRYLEVNMNVRSDIEIDRDMDETITAFLQSYVNKYGFGSNSDYEHRQYEIEELTDFYTALLAIVAIGFVICGSIINNTVTASIRERKKEIGTLRAVGADIRVLTASYIRQLLYSLGLGYLMGFGSFMIFQVMYKIFEEKFNEAHWYFTFPVIPWETLALSAVLFAICSVNLWTKVRKEMKNSIVDNIREL